jgi:hypothetical protein
MRQIASARDVLTPSSTILAVCQEWPDGVRQMILAKELDGVENSGRDVAMVILELT